MGVLFGVVIGKMIFGGLGMNIFNFVVVGCVFIVLVFIIFFIGFYGFIDVVVGVIVLFISFFEVLNSYLLIDLFVGNILGFMGEINFFVILFGFVYLLIRKSVDYRFVLLGLLIFIVFVIVVGFILYFILVFEYVIF